MKELESMKELLIKNIKLRDNPHPHKHNVTICYGMDCLPEPLATMEETFLKEIKENNITDKIVVEKINLSTEYGCHIKEPFVLVYPEGILYGELIPEEVIRVTKQHLMGGEPVTDLVLGYPVEDEKVAQIEDLPYHHMGTSIALRLYKRINAENILEYIAYDGYKALAKALTEMSKEDIINEVKASGLRGRGGGGFSTGLKWELTYKAQDDTKSIICNADEGDPGAFMDRSILEADPHSIIEAMAIAGYAIGASQGFVYVRAEYPVAANRLKTALNQARKLGFIGDGILGTDFCFDIEIRLGAGAFICGEETALINSIEGHRGMPCPRPPFPAVKGLWGKPTLINNVETFANIPQIILKGASWFAGIGTEKSKGTKVFALGGKIAHAGLAEVPMGTTLYDVIYDIGGGIPDGKKFKAVQTGGPSGGCLTENDLNTPVDYESLVALGSMMGSGGMVIMDEDNCMVDIAKFFLHFMVDESCGKCPPCRIGTKRMHEILEKICHGKGTIKDVDNLERLASNIKTSSLCALGQTAANPVLSTLRHFRDEYIAHVKDKVCPAGACQDLTKFFITNSCIACSICKKNCPVDAISGEKKQKHEIDTIKCIKCGICQQRCPFNAIIKK